MTKRITLSTLISVLLLLSGVYTVLAMTDIVRLPTWKSAGQEVVRASLPSFLEVTDEGNITNPTQAPVYLTATSSFEMMVAIAKPNTFSTDSFTFSPFVARNANEISNSLAFTLAAGVPNTEHIYYILHDGIVYIPTLNKTGETTRLQTQKTLYGDAKDGLSASDLSFLTQSIGKTILPDTIPSDINQSTSTTATIYGYYEGRPISFDVRYHYTSKAPPDRRDSPSMATVDYCGGSITCIIKDLLNAFFGFFTN